MPSELRNESPVMFRLVGAAAVRPSYSSTSPAPRYTSSSEVVQSQIDGAVSIASTLTTICPSDVKSILYPTTSNTLFE